MREQSWLRSVCDVRRRLPRVWLPVRRCLWRHGGCDFASCCRRLAAVQFARALIGRCRRAGVCCTPVSPACQFPTRLTADGRDRWGAPSVNWSQLLDPPEPEKILTEHAQPSKIVHNRCLDTILPHYLSIILQTDLHSVTNHIAKMASKSFQKALRSQVGRQLASPAVQRRTFVAAASGAARATAVKAARPAVSRQQVRGVKTIDFAGVKEDVYGKQAQPTPNWCAQERLGRV